MLSTIATSFTRLCLAFVLGGVLLIPPKTAAQAVVYVKGPPGAGDIFRQVGDTVTQLTNSPGEDDEPDQSPDGECIVFSSDRDGPFRIYLMNADGSNQRPLSPMMSGVEEFEPEFSSDGTRIAFVHKEDGRTSVWTMNKDGSDRKRLTPIGPFQYIRPRWQPGSRDMLFNCREDDDEDDLRPQPGRNQSTSRTRDVILWDDSLGSNRLFIASTSDNYDAEWSPDGSKVSLTVQDGQGSAIVVADLDTITSQFVTGGSVDGNSTWVGNNTVAFERMTGGNTDIFTVNADGTGLANRSDNPADDTNPVGWEEGAAALRPVLFRGDRAQSAPQILFVSDRTGNNDIFVMNADGTGQTNLTNSPEDESDPQFYIAPTPAAPSISAGGVVMANLLPTVNQVSPRSIISVFGENFASGTTLFPTLDVNGDLDRILAGTCLEMNGERLPIFAVTPGQINAQVSDSQALGSASFTVITDCDAPSALRSEARTLSRAPRALTSDAETATVEEATPVFFIFNPVASDGFIAARFNATESQAPVPVAPASSFPNDSFGPSRPAEPGDIVLLYGTGWGETSPSFAAGELATDAAEVLSSANPMVTFGGVLMDPADVIYVGVTPNSAGLYQLALRIPANAQPGNNQVVLTVYNKSTPTGPVIPVVVP